jgi:hypothetical protein
LDSGVITQAEFDAEKAKYDSLRFVHHVLGLRRLNGTTVIQEVEAQHAPMQHRRTQTTVM